MTTDNRTRRTPWALAVLGAATVAAATLTAAAVPAQAQSMLRSQSRIINQAINRQVTQALRPLLVVRNALGPVRAMEMAAGGTLAAFAMADGVHVWDLASGRQIGVVAAGDVQAMAVAAAGRTLATADAAGVVTLWDAGTGLAQHRLPAGSPVRALALAPGGGTVAAGGSDGAVRLWSVANARPLAMVAGAHGGAVGALAFSPSGTLVASGGEDGRVRLWAAASGAPGEVFSADGTGIARLAFADEGTVLAGGADGQVRVWRPGEADAQHRFRVAAGPVQGLAALADGRVVASGPGQPPAVYGRTGDRIAALGAAASTPVFAAALPGGGQVLTAGADGRGRVWDAADGHTVAQVIMTRGGWSVVDAAGRYDGSGGGIEDIARQADREVFEMANFAEPYYEPGLLAKLLTAPAALLTPNAAPVEAGIAPPPTVEVAVGAVPAGPGPATVTVTAADRGDGIATVILYHNGKALPPSRVSASHDETRSGQTVRVVDYTVPLIGGTNTLRAVASGANRIESVPAETTVTVATPPAARKPTLHMVVIGINQYANPQLELNYAVADARGLVQWARSNLKAVFGEVKLYELYDRRATRPAIANLFGTLERTGPEDVVIAYFAGHGETAEDVWHFLPTEFGAGLPFGSPSDGPASDGRGATAFREALVKAVTADGIPAGTLRDDILNLGAQRVLVLIDSCKSGSLKRAFDGDAETRQLQLLSRQVGVHILAATAKEQLAVEIESLGHGAFTYAVLQGLAGAADRQPADGIVTVKEMLSHTVQQVPHYAFRYANSEQFPTVFSLGTDFPVSPAGKAAGKKR